MQLKKAMMQSKSASVRALIGAVAFELGDLDTALSRLDEIGRTLQERQE